MSKMHVILKTSKYNCLYFLTPTRNLILNCTVKERNIWRKKNQNQNTERKKKLIRRRGKKIFHFVNLFVSIWCWSCKIAFVLPQYTLQNLFLLQVCITKNKRNGDTRNLKIQNRKPFMGIASSSFHLLAYSLVHLLKNLFLFFRHKKFANFNFFFCQLPTFV